MPKKFDELQQAILQQIKKDNPNMDEDELNSKAWAIAQSQFKKMNNQLIKPKLTEDGKFIVAENVKLILNSSIMAVDTIQE